jgi:hypothetical protein
MNTVTLFGSLQRRIFKNGKKLQMLNLPLAEQELRQQLRVKNRKKGKK